MVKYNSYYMYVAIISRHALDWSIITQNPKYRNQTPFLFPNTWLSRLYFLVSKHSIFPFPVYSINDRIFWSWMVLHTEESEHIIWFFVKLVVFLFCFLMSGLSATAKKKVLFFHLLWYVLVEGWALCCKQKHFCIPFLYLTNTL